MSEGEKWRCIWISGDGLENDEGIFSEVKRTNKLLVLEMTQEGFFAQYPQIKKRRIPLPDSGGRRTSFCPAVSEWPDGNITVYHEARGIPFIYSRVTPPLSKESVKIWR